jgi:hypothetical protein
MAIFLVIISAIFAASASLCTKKNLEKVGTSQGYLVIYFLFSLVATFFSFIGIIHTPFNPPIFAVGAITGILIFIMMIMLPKALQHGPAGITFAFQNASSVMPSLLLFFLFGSAFHFALTPFTIIGILLIITGLILSAFPQIFSEMHKKNPHLKHAFTSSKMWGFYITLVFILQAIIFSIFHWRSLLIESDQSHSLLFVSSSLEADLWFLPGSYIMATLLNALVFLFEKRGFKKSELIFGAIGGSLNGTVTYFLLWAVDIATVEKPILFPLFAISVILFCSFWGKRLYKETINWVAISLCILGIFLATL